MRPDPSPLSVDRASLHMSPISFRVIGGAVDRSAYGLFLAVVALAPLPFGLTAPLPIALACIALALCLILADQRGLSARHLIPIAPVPIVFALYVGAALLQLSPLGAAWFGPAAAWRELSWPHDGVGALVSWTATGPWLALGPALLLVLTVLTAAGFSKRRDRAMSLLRVVAISGTCYAVYGILAHLIEPHKLLWRDKFAYLDAVTGTFVNRNTAATYWGSCAVVCLGLALAELAHKRRRRRGRTRLYGWLAALALCLIATAMTGSRGGALVTLVALAFSGMLWLAGGDYRGKVRWIMAGIGALGLVLVGQLLGGLVEGRVREYGFFDQRRIEAYADTIRMIRDHPWLGIGLGNFATVFPRYRSELLGSSGVWDRAHSTPLEIAAEMGLPVTIVIIGCFFWMVYALLKGCIRRKRDRAIPVAAAGVAIFGVMHSSIDFSLQIAGYAVVFGAVVGAGMAQSVSSRDVAPSCPDGSTV